MKLLTLWAGKVSKIHRYAVLVYAWSPDVAWPSHVAGTNRQSSMQGKLWGSTDLKSIQQDILEASQGSLQVSSKPKSGKRRRSPTDVGAVDAHPLRHVRIA